MLCLEMRKTFQNAAKGNGLVYCGATSDPESLQWLSSLFLFTLEALLHLDATHRSFPWRVVTCLNEQLKEETLACMAEEWALVTEFIDQLSERHELYKKMSWTRYQCYRDCMVKAELLVCFCYTDGSLGVRALPGLLQFYYA